MWKRLFVVCCALLMAAIYQLSTRDTLGFLIPIGGLCLLAAFGVGRSRRRPSRLRRFLSASLLFVGLVPITIGTYQLACLYQPRPAPVSQPVFHGVDYIREVLERPAPAIVHLLKVDLSADGVEVLITPPDDPQSAYPLRARTTSRFVREFNLQAAINASNFFPFERQNPLSLVPFLVDPKSILGGAASRGIQYGEPSRFYPVLHIDSKGHGSIVHNLPRPWYTATAGIKHFIVGGRLIPMGADAPEARTSVGLDKSGRMLFLVVVDGRQSPYSAGLGRKRLAKLLLKHGVYDALSLDGGGSSTMVIQGADGSPQLLNRPVQGGLPGIERPVGNHIGIFANPLPN